MSYSKIDFIIEKWASDNALHLYKEYKGEEVRSVEIINSVGKKHQIWIDPPRENKITVSAWNFKKKSKTWKVKYKQLESTLSEALNQVNNWK